MVTVILIFAVEFTVVVVFLVLLKKFVLGPKTGEGPSKKKNMKK